MAVTSQKMTDESVMPFGKYKGMYLIEVPANWLLWYYENAEFGRDEALIAYIEDNMQALRSEC